eukprot:CAMPEP_0167744390 /NCGR_PEP_ID=MMETSP0110_2-20121227/2565_1 /TAXON_ID=629695 /ORGANISM="Gymnochlora sp., Strain CCMP2014" /LENGTH=365 /DNA_ID=CAMNT_0007628907 /DNA_START=41 /DNA_END=1138 /DNA_ORIENTATION=+
MTKKSTKSYFGAFVVVGSALLLLNLFLAPNHLLLGRVPARSAQTTSAFNRGALSSPFNRNALRSQRSRLPTPNGWGGIELHEVSFEEDLKKAREEGRNISLSGGAKGSGRFGFAADDFDKAQAEMDAITKPLYGDEALEKIRAEKDLWIFAYGDNMWEEKYPIAEARAGWVKGFLRRFWALSTKHYGKPGYPGRSLTMIREPGSWMWGYLHRIAEEDREKVMSLLAEEAEEGEIPQVVEFGYCLPAKEGGGYRKGLSLSYVMDQESEGFSKLEDATEIAREVCRSVGEEKSGVGYLLSLYNTMRKIPGFDRTEGYALDHHVDDIVEILPVNYRKEKGFIVRKSRLAKFNLAPPKFKKPEPSTFNA